VFHIDVTTEDNRLIARESEDFDHGMPKFDVQLIDNMTGSRHVLKNIEVCDVERLVGCMICCHEPKPGDYARLEPLLVDCPTACRPIP